MGNAIDPRVKTVLALLDSGWNEPVKLPDLADRVGLGQSRLEHLFKEQIGCCVREYVARLRFENAALLLLGTHLTVKEISTLVGISDRCNFNHSFKRRFGMSPRRYRSRQFSERAPLPAREGADLQSVAS